VKTTIIEPGSRYAIAAVPCLDDAAAIASAVAQFKQLVRWLKDLEKSELRQAHGTDVPPFDFAWMWQELGIESER